MKFALKNNEFHRLNIKGYYNVIDVGRKNKYTGKTPEISHRELVDRAFTYLKFSFGCSVVFKERKTSISEEPDAIGFGGSSGTILIECKSSRADYLADAKKFFRRRPEEGMGYKRYYMAPVGLLGPTEIQDDWGLLEVYDKPPRLRSRTVKRAKESKAFFERNTEAEVRYLTSAIRRLDISMAVFVEVEPR